jgi:hypothetical protein
MNIEKHAMVELMILNGIDCHTVLSIPSCDPDTKLTRRFFLQPLNGATAEVTGKR